MMATREEASCSRTALPQCLKATQKAAQKVATSWRHRRQLTAGKGWNGDKGSDRNWKAQEEKGGDVGEREKKRGGEQAIRQGDSEIAEAWFDQAVEYWKQAIALTPGNYIEAQNWLKITRRFK
ncbi:conserved hypothetical protein [Ricinus communis]|uniref:Uncharacterized protein n=1 Tax=Ricinus communis TaxID=3988 RepID=B9S874_RICCO|nr:conserved hypothetical protein [Ricinus communis]